MFRRTLGPFQRTTTRYRACRNVKMDAVIQQSIQLVRVKARNEVPWDFDQPYAQPYHR